MQEESVQVGRMGMRGRRLKVAAAAYSVSVLFLLAWLLATLVPHWIGRQGLPQLAALGVAIAIAAPLALTFVWNRLIGIKIWAIQISLQDVAQKLDDDPTARIVGEARDETRAKFANEIEKAIREAMKSQTTNLVAIDLRAGTDWRTTRLFFLAALADRYTWIPSLVFVADCNDESSCFVGLATPGAVRRRLAERYPYLEQRFRKAYSEGFDENRPIDRLDEVACVSQKFKDAFGGTLHQDDRREWVTVDLLRSCMGSDLQVSVINWPVAPETQLLRWQIVSQSTPFVVVRRENISSERELDRLEFVDRLTLAARTASASLRREIDTG